MRTSRRAAASSIQMSGRAIMAATVTTRLSVIVLTSGHGMTTGMANERYIATLAKGPVPGCVPICGCFGAFIKPTCTCMSRRMRRWSTPNG
jgi:hypothetical protein